MKTLSILIPTLVERNVMCQQLINELAKQFQATEFENAVEILRFIDDGELTTGTKRNRLLDMALTDYVVFFDDDDWPEPNYVYDIMFALQKEPDVVGFNGYMTTDGKQRTPWKISKELPYQTMGRGKDLMYLRFNNHLSPIKKSIAREIGFPDLNHGEDYDYAVRLKRSGLIKTEIYLDKELYHYRYSTKK
jgi:glycosyltransferase involved in cell wall biosynthesis